MKERVNGMALAAVLRAPTRLCDATPRGFAALARLAQREALLGRLAASAREAGVLDGLAPVAREVLESAWRAAQASRTQTLWEAARIRRALLAYDGPLILLKGAAYFAIALPGSAGRWCSDVDILVPRARLAEVEAQLIAAGWASAKQHPYDDAYYRRWMHELPPLRHLKRRTVVDVHHAILPLTARLKPSPEALLQAACASPLAGLDVLAPADMALHSAAHACHDGDFTGGLRNLFDLTDLIDFFAARDAAFTGHLADRARALDLGRPLAYGVRFARAVTGWTPPAGLEAMLARHLPAAPLLRLMDHLVARAVGGADPWRPTNNRLARRALYARAHWLRMPPLMLARHLVVKAWRGQRQEGAR
ncbi:MAG: nucleotidyltransferase domain-containing protein [Pseudomonadota bacterium]